MKNISIPILFFISVILQIISCYIFLGSASKFEFLGVSVFSTILSTTVVYSILYFISKSKSEYLDSISEVKVGVTVFTIIIISFLTVYLINLLKYTSNFEYLITVNILILSIYTRQIINKEIINIIK